MSRPVRTAFAVARLTAVEALRRPICFLLFLFCVSFLALLPFLVTHTLGESRPMIVSSALALVFVVGLALSGAAASSSMMRDIARGTAGSILCKPVSRELFFLAKVLGVAAVVALFIAAAAPAVLAASRTARVAFAYDRGSAVPLLLSIPAALTAAGLRNGLARKPFCSTAVLWLAVAGWLAFLISCFFDAGGALQPFGRGVLWSLGGALFLLLIALWVLAALAVALAPRLNPAPLIVSVFLLFLLGLMAEFFSARAADLPALRAALAAVPNWQHFWMADAMREERSIPGAYLAAATLYGLLLCGGILSLGARSFSRMELK
jgi:ABC-type Na+ efflux pump permease subunit